MLSIDFNFNVCRSGLNVVCCLRGSFSLGPFSWFDKLATEMVQWIFVSYTKKKPLGEWNILRWIERYIEWRDLNTHFALRWQYYVFFFFFEIWMRATNMFDSNSFEYLSYAHYATNIYMCFFFFFHCSCNHATSNANTSSFTAAMSHSFWPILYTYEVKTTWKCIPFLELNKRKLNFLFSCQILCDNGNKNFITQLSKWTHIFFAPFYVNDIKIYHDYGFFLLNTPFV